MKSSIELLGVAVAADRSASQKHRKASNACDKLRTDVAHLSALAPKAVLCKPNMLQKQT